MYRIDTTRETPPDWLTVEEYEALSTDPEAEQVGEEPEGGRVCGNNTSRDDHSRMQTALLACK